MISFILKVPLGLYMINTIQVIDLLNSRDWMIDTNSGKAAKGEEESNNILLNGKHRIVTSGYLKCEIGNDSALLWWVC